jgi:hypothetical protein
MTGEAPVVVAVVEVEISAIHIQTTGNANKSKQTHSKLV